MKVINVNVMLIQGVWWKWVRIAEHVYFNLLHVYVNNQHQLWIGNCYFNRDCIWNVYVE